MARPGNSDQQRAGWCQGWQLFDMPRRRHTSRPGHEGTRTQFFIGANYGAPQAEGKPCSINTSQGFAPTTDAGLAAYLIELATCR